MIAVILAGGAGTRFWPLSRRTRPKQLIKLWGDRVMIAQSVDRLLPLCGPDKIFVVCGPHLIENIRKSLPELPDNAFITEPAARNTAPAIGLAAICAQARFDDEVIGIFPSDHYIGRQQDFEACVREAESCAGQNAIVTLGIKPSRPETGYGYIRFKDESSKTSENSFDVDAFVEKPNLETAYQYLESGQYLWNAGMFFFKPSIILNEMKKHMPETYKQLSGIKDALNTDHYHDTLQKNFLNTEAVSIDYGIMEYADNIKVIPASFAWSDVGHWAALEAINEPDENNNIIFGSAELKDTQNTIIYNGHPENQKIVAALGVDNMVIVDTPDALLVIPKNRAQDVRQIVKQLKDNHKASWTD